MRAVASVDRDRAAAVAARLATIPDPELPVVSIVDLGMIHDVTVSGPDVRVAILPTFIGCPALDLVCAGPRLRGGPTRSPALAAAG